MLQKPDKNEYPAFYHTYISKLPDTPILKLLAEGTIKLSNLTKILTEEQAEKSYAPGKWSVKELIGHMMDTERIMAYRCLCISRQEKQFLPGFNENDYVAASNFNKQPLGDLLNQYRLLRDSNLALFRNMDEIMWGQVGIANGSPVSAHAIAAIIAGHEMHHLAILQERYLPVVSV